MISSSANVNTGAGVPTEKASVPVPSYPFNPAPQDRIIF